MPSERCVAADSQRELEISEKITGLSACVCRYLPELSGIDATTKSKWKDKAAQNIGQIALHSHAI
jgi:hypothetical protein